MIVEAFLICLFLYLIIYKLTPKRPPNFPPGPRNYPIVGSLISLLKAEGEFSGAKLTSLEGKYGPITGMYLRSMRTIVLNGYDVIKEVTNRDDFIHRPALFILTFMYGGRSLGVFSANGHLWKEQRRFALRNLRDFGFGKSSMEGLIHEETEECISSIKTALKVSPDSVVLMHDKFRLSIVNILLAVVTGKRYNHEDKDFQRILELITTMFRNFDFSGSIVNDYPWIRYIPIANYTYKCMEQGCLAVRHFLEKSIEDHKKTKDPIFSRDFIDIYIKEMDEEKKNGVADSTFFEEQLLAICSDLFIAGAESTSNTIAFCVLYMTLYPEIQEKLHEELDAVVPNDRLPSVNDKKSLHYLEAVMTEVYRITPIGPIPPPRSNIQDVKLMGYDIPKDTFVLFSIRSVHMDKRYWGDPEVFRPERFLNDKGEFVKPERVLAFGTGKRVCLGEPLARMSAFLLFSGVMQKFKFELASGKPKPSTIPKDGISVAPRPFFAKLTPRN